MANRRNKPLQLHYLKADKERKNVANKQVVCKKGHVMSETRKYYSNGSPYCSTCKIERSNISRQKNPEKHALYSWKSRIKKMYGITEEEYTVIFTEQDGKCAICNISLGFRSKQTHIDHEHSTGIVRGLLCHSCNTALGLFKEDEAIMLKAILYLNMSSARKSKRKKKGS